MNRIDFRNSIGVRYYDNAGTIVFCLSDSGITTCSAIKWLITRIDIDNFCIRKKESPAVYDQFVSILAAGTRPPRDYNTDVHY
ncbi:hypothetical protein ABZ769_36955 [Streptomyces olivoreticuli]